MDCAALQVSHTFEPKHCIRPHNAKQFIVFHVSAANPATIRLVIFLAPYWQEKFHLYLSSRRFMVWNVFIQQDAICIQSAHRKRIENTINEACNGSYCVSHIHQWRKNCVIFEIANSGSYRARNAFSDLWMWVSSYCVCILSHSVSHC